MSNLISPSCRLTGASVAGKNYVVKKVPLPEKTEEEMQEKKKAEDKPEEKEDGDKPEGEEKEEEEVKENQTNLLPYQIEILEKAFKAFAQEEDFISPEMVGKILRMMGVAFTEDSLQEMINEIDEDGSGQIEFEEFIQLAVKFVEDEDEDVEKELKEAFRMYDKEGQGFITTATLKQILHEIDDALTDEELDQIIIEVDSDGSGTLDFDEFVEMMNG